MPVPSKYLRGQDSLYSIVQMPKGVPVATFAIGEAGAANAALYAAQILSVTDAGLAQKLADFRAAQNAKARAMELPALTRKFRHMNANEVLMPGETLGLMGGGQLGRMFAQAAATMGYHVAVLGTRQGLPRGRSLPRADRKRSTTTWPASPRSQAG